ncbi:hypothetical protein [Lichenifustis flavocetrariae]|uniref:Uncharacterized protein n=1 Tax=Lichenifustis flavocetrariae TaxID=2949735 RepID=A0AA41YZG5_9HYPH|nr:hypothetical protein [Lichenifustis flavocetrariae]MCW6509943.1 hypothetical protein [Lichenifustis flavocetrariae]
MKTLGFVAAAALVAPLVFAGPSQARTAFQDFAQGRGVYVSSKDHPPGGLQDTAETFGALPPSSPYFYDRRGDVPPPYGYEAPGY